MPHALPLIPPVWRTIASQHVAQDQKITDQKEPCSSLVENHASSGGAAERKEVEHSTYFFVEGHIILQHRQGGICAKLCEYAETHNTYVETDIEVNGLIYKRHRIDVLMDFTSAKGCQEICRSGS
jgi:hypothetical protein